MSAHLSPDTPVGGGSWLFRALVLLPALVTVVVFGASWVLQRDGAMAAPSEGLELLPAQGSRMLADPAFGPPLTDVFSAAAAVELPDGWAVLDTRAQQLVLLDQEARLVRRVGGTGEGPGELARAAHLARTDSFLVVGDRGGRTLDLFDLEGVFLRRVLVEDSACMTDAARSLLGEGEGLVLVRSCIRDDMATFAVLERVEFDGTRQVLAERLLNDPRQGPFDITRAPLAALAGGRLYFGIESERCVTVIDAAAGEADSVCHPDTNPVVLPDSVAASLRDMGARLPLMGATFVAPTRLPPFDRVLEVGGRLAFHVVLDGETHALEVVGEDGRLERVVLPSRARMSVGRRGILLAQDRLEGTAFAVLPLP